MDVNVCVSVCVLNLEGWTLEQNKPSWSKTVLPANTSNNSMKETQISDFKDMTQIFILPLLFLKKEQKRKESEFDMQKWPFCDSVIHP